MNKVEKAFDKGRGLIYTDYDAERGIKNIWRAHWSWSDQEGYEYILTSHAIPWCKSCNHARPEFAKTTHTRNTSIDAIIALMRLIAPINKWRFDG